MSGPLRRWLVPVAGGVLTAVVMGAAIADRPMVGLAALGLVGGLALLVLEQIRRRAGDASHALRLAARRDREVAGAVGKSRSTLGEVARRLSALDRHVRSVEARVAAAERRLVAGVENVRLQELDHHDAVLPLVVRAADRASSDVVTRAVKQEAARNSRHVTSVAQQLRDEIEDLLQLVRMVEAPTVLPRTGQWAMDPRTLAHLISIVRSERPATVLELGSGSSTIWLGHVLAEYGGRIMSVDHDREYRDATVAELERHGLLGVAEVRHAPLRPLHGFGSSLWYDVSALDGISGIDLLVVDGPPKATGPHARWPALPVLEPRLADHATIALDDAQRPEEAESVDRWLAAYPNLRRFDVGVSRLTILRRSRFAGKVT